MRNIPRQLIDDETYSVHYILYNNDNGEKEFVYIAVRKTRMLAFQKAIIEGNFDLEDYGVVLEEGKGEASPALKDRMRILYKCDHGESVPANKRELKFEAAS